MHRVISREKTGREEKGREKEGRSKDALRSRLFFFFFLMSHREEGDIKENRKQRAGAFYFTVSTAPLLLKKIAGWFCASDGTLIVVLVNEA